MPRKKTRSFDQLFERAMHAAAPPPKELSFAGYDFTSGSDGTKIKRDTIDLKKSGDYGADPIGDGRFRMVPSGDIVDFEERNRRLKK